MPTMPRIKGKGTNIAYKILGVPASFAHKETEKEKRFNKRLVFEETTRVR